MGFFNFKIVKKTTVFGEQDMTCVNLANKITKVLKIFLQIINNVSFKYSDVYSVSTNRL